MLRPLCAAACRLGPAFGELPKVSSGRSWPLSQTFSGVAPFTTAPYLLLKRSQMPPRPKPPPETDIDESFLKGSGPGGQKINKTSSAVQLKHIPTGIVVKSQATRSREQNRKIARDLLANRLDEMFNGEQSRSAIVGDNKKRRADSAAKKSRRKYRKLEEEKQETADKAPSKAPSKASSKPSPLSS